MQNDRLVYMRFLFFRMPHLILKVSKLVVDLHLIMLELLLKVINRTPIVWLISKIRHWLPDFAWLRSTKMSPTSYFIVIIFVKSHPSILKTVEVVHSTSLCILVRVQTPNHLTTLETTINLRAAPLPSYRKKQILWDMNKY